MSAQRMFRWKDHLIVATNQYDAWHHLCRVYVDYDPDVVDGDMAGIGSMDQYERETREGDCDPEIYDVVPAKQYLHAVDPGEVLEIPDYELPQGWEGTPGHGDAIMWAATSTAATWAQHLPNGWHWDMGG